MSASPANQGSRPAIAILPSSQGYERWASSYDETPNPLLALEEREVVPRLPEIRQKRVLDLGCGTGRWLRILGLHFPAFMVGVDASPAMLGRASRNFQTLVQANCLQLPFASGLFEFVMCSFTVGHIPELGLFARECARMLRPHGTLFVTDLHPQAYALGWRTGFRDSNGAVEIVTVSHPWRDSIELFSSAGLACAAIDAFHFGNPERSIFAEAGKHAFFSEAGQVPAVVLSRFSRVN